MVSGLVHVLFGMDLRDSGIHVITGILAGPSKFAFQCSFIWCGYMSSPDTLLLSELEILP